MNIGIVYAILGAVAFGFWTVFHQQASSHIHNLLGSILVSLTAVLLGAILIIPQIKVLTYSPKGILFAVLGGVCALAIDYFALKSYSSGLAISVSGPIIIGGSIAVATLVGFILGDTITVSKITSLILIGVGAVMLASQGN